MIKPPEKTPLIFKIATGFILVFIGITLAYTFFPELSTLGQKSETEQTFTSEETNLNTIENDSKMEKNKESSVENKVNTFANLNPAKFYSVESINSALSRLGSNTNMGFEDDFFVENAGCITSNKIKGRMRDGSSFISADIQLKNPLTKSTCENLGMNAYYLETVWTGAQIYLKPDKGYEYFHIKEEKPFKMIEQPNKYLQTFLSRISNIKITKTLWNENIVTLETEINNNTASGILTFKIDSTNSQILEITYFEQLKVGSSINGKFIADYNPQPITKPNYKDEIIIK